MVSDACHWACILQVMYDNIVIISSMLSFVAECRTNCAVISLATIQDSGLLMNFFRPSKSIWSSLFKTWHWLQDKIASLSWGMTIFFGLFYIHLKGVFFLSLVFCGQNVISALFSELSTCSKLHGTKCLWSTKFNNQKIPHAVPRVTYIRCSYCWGLQWRCKNSHWIKIFWKI